MNKTLVLGDIHGRDFWVKPCANLDEYDKVIFLGDYLDPYAFEEITVPDAIENFKKIIELKRANREKVVLLYGNHDMPYAFTAYYRFSWFHCRHSNEFHDEIKKLFNENKDLFQIAFAHNNILYTHAGVESGWMKNVVKCESDDIDEICNELNSLTETERGLGKLYMITSERGGRDRYGSCIWSDIHDMMWDFETTKSPDAVIQPIQKVRQIFGHTIQAFYDRDRNIAFGDPIEFGNCKMIDVARPFIVDEDNFKLIKIE